MLSRALELATIAQRQSVRDHVRGAREDNFLATESKIRDI